MRTVNLFINVAIIASIFMVGCASDVKKNRGHGVSWDKEEDSANAKPDDHAGGKNPDEAPISKEDDLIMQKLFAVAPLQEGHFMNDLIQSNRPFRPEEGLGFWSAFGLSWQDEGAVFVMKDANVSFAFTAPEGVETECRLDTGAWADCTGKASAEKVGEGFHEMHVRGKVGHTILGTVRWQLDVSAPKVFVAKDLVSKNYLVKSSEPLATLSCKVAGKDVDCAVAGFAAAAGTAVEVQATDKAGNATSATVNI